MGTRERRRPGCRAGGDAGRRRALRLLGLVLLDLPLDLVLVLERGALGRLARHGGRVAESTSGDWPGPEPGETTQ